MNFCKLSKISFSKTGGFMGISNWFRLKSYTKQNHKIRRVPCKKPYSIWIKNKKNIQKSKTEKNLKRPIQKRLKMEYFGHNSLGCGNYWVLSLQKLLSFSCSIGWYMICGVFFKISLSGCPPSDAFGASVFYERYLIFLKPFVQRNILKHFL